jgi:hypothetical protein
MLGNLLQPGSLNRYAYVMGDPIGSVDPEGLAPQTITGEITVTACDPAGGCYSFGSIAEGLGAYFEAMRRAVGHTLEFRQARQYYDRESAAATASGDDLLSALYSGVGAALDAYAAVAACPPNVKCGTVMIGGISTNAYGINLSKSIASQSQLAEAQLGIGEAIAGAGTRAILKDEARLLAQYGPGRWAKMKSTWVYVAKDGKRVETHFYKNLTTGQVVEFKSKWP